MSGDAGSLPNSGGDVNRIEDLLDSPEWHEKLARAREQREKILAERALMASSAEKRRKPWEMPPPDRKAARQAPTVFPRLEFSPDNLVRPVRDGQESGQVVPIPSVAIRDSQLEGDDGRTIPFGADASPSAPIDDATSVHLNHVDEFVLGAGFLDRLLHIKSERNDSTPNDAAASDDPGLHKTLSRILVARQEGLETGTDSKTAPLMLDGGERSDAPDHDAWVPGATAQPDIRSDLPQTAPAEELAPVVKPARSAGQRSLEAIPVSRTLDTLMPEPAVVAEAATGHRKALLVMAMVVAGAVIGAGLALMPGEDGPVTEQNAPLDTGTEASAARVEVATGPATMTEIAIPAGPAPESGTAYANAAPAAVPPQRGPVLTLPVAGAPDGTLTAIPGNSRIATMSEIVDIAAPTVVLGQDAVAGFIGAQGGLGIAPPGVAIDRPAVSSLPATDATPVAFEPPTLVEEPEVAAVTQTLKAPVEGDALSLDLPGAEAVTETLPEAQHVAVPAPESEAAPLVTATAEPLPVTPPKPDVAEPEEAQLAPEVSIAPEPRPETITPKVTQGIDLSGITVHMLAPSSLDLSMLDQTAVLLTDEGFALATPKEVDLKISVTQVRYYYAADAEAATALAKLANAEPRDFTGGDSRPPAGTVELWFAGQPDGSAPAAKPVAAKKSSGTAKAATKKAAARKPAPAPAVDSESELRDRVLRQLRGGEHLKKK